MEERQAIDCSDFDASDFAKIDASRYDDSAVNIDNIEQKMKEMSIFVIVGVGQYYSQWETKPRIPNMSRCGRTTVGSLKKNIR